MNWQMTVGVGSFALLAGCAAHEQVPVSADERCAAITSVRTSDYLVSAITAQLVPASLEAPFAVPGTSAKISKPFCRVAGTAHSNAASAIRFELWLPTPAAWNGRFAGTASGGSAGDIRYLPLSGHLSLGYASIAHDNGHVSTGFDQKWAYDPVSKSTRTEQVVDWAYRAQHVVTVIGKQLTAAFYGRSPRRSYYNGCSQSGHHGMMEVQRYPEDYDGVVAGAHTSDWTTNMASQAWAAYQQFGRKGAGAIPKALYAQVHQAVLERCDGQPGVDHLKDGVLDDPRRCPFDPHDIECRPGFDAPGKCLTSAQVQSLRSMYSGYKDAAGDTVAIGYPAGVEAGHYWPNETTSPLRPQGSWADYLRYAVFLDPAYDFSRFDFDRDPALAREKLRGTYDAYETNLAAFQRRGGKLLMYHGWEDSLISPLLTLEYWNAVRATMGASEVDKFVRLYMVPGMDHCGGGAGTTNFVMIDAVANWVENGVAPDATGAADTIIAKGSDARTRPLCPYPKIARYIGTGDVMHAKNFRCTPQ